MAWEKARAGFLRKHPRCECAEHKGKADAPRATVVDHHKPHKGDKVLFWDSSNWVPMAAPCHSRKTATEDGGFGNRTPGGTSKKVDDSPADRAMPTEYAPSKLGAGGGFF